MKDIFLDKYYFNTGIPSDISKKIYPTREQYEYWSGDRNMQFQAREFGGTFIEQDGLLKYLHSFLKGKLKLFKFPSMTNYKWHVDSENVFNLNLIFTEQKGYTLFKCLEGDCDKNDVHAVLTPILKVKYVPNIWYLFNAQTPHCIFNFDDATRYLLTYNVPKSSPITYDETIELIKKYRS